jgi:phospholipid/cholesterol/gamma-HCH transport system substrate-binding protein
MFKHLHFKVGLFVIAVLALALGFLFYVLNARGFFEQQQHLNLAAGSAEGITPGVPITFSGMPIGQVTGVTLNDGGGIVIQAEVTADGARWLRTDSSFTLDKPIVGGAKIKVSSANLDSPQLPDNSTVLLLTSDPGQEIPVLIERVKTILANVDHITRQDGELASTLANTKTITTRMTGKYGVLEGVLGSEENARPVANSLKNLESLTARLNQVSNKVDDMLVKTDRWLFAADGVSEQSKQSLAQVHAMLVDAQGSLKRVDALLKNAVDISANVKDGTQDLGKLRAEVDESVSKANDLLNDINRMWPFGSGDKQIKLP